MTELMFFITDDALDIVAQVIYNFIDYAQVRIAFVVVNIVVNKHYYIMFVVWGVAIFIR